MRNRDLKAEGFAHEVGDIVRIQWAMDNIHYGVVLAAERFDDGSKTPAERYLVACMVRDPEGAFALHIRDYMDMSLMSAGEDEVARDLKVNPGLFALIGFSHPLGFLLREVAQMGTCKTAADSAPRGQQSVCHKRTTPAPGNPTGCHYISRSIQRDMVDGRLYISYGSGLSEVRWTQVPGAHFGGFYEVVGPYRKNEK
jgi:hypothetical protein